MRTAMIALTLMPAMFLGGTAHAAPHTFAGSCQVTGIVKWDSYQARSYVFDGAGTCTGSLDGQMIQDAPVTTTTEGDVYAFIAPVLGSGLGTLGFADQNVTFPIGVQQVGAALRVFVACQGCSGTALGVLQTFTETQPAPEPEGPRNAIRIFTQTTTTFMH